MQNTPLTTAPQCKGPLRWDHDILGVTRVAGMLLMGNLWITIDLLWVKQSSKNDSFRVDWLEFKPLLTFYFSRFISSPGPAYSKTCNFDQS